MEIIELGAPAVCGGADTRTDTGAATGAGRCTAVLGCFDGVHTAHAQLIETGRRVAHELGTPLAVWTLRGLSKSGRGVLLGEKEKLEQFRSLGVDARVYQRFFGCSRSKPRAIRARRSDR